MHIERERERGKAWSVYRSTFAMASCDPATMENGNKSCNKELANRIGLTNMASASSSLRKRSDIALLSKVKHPVLKQILANLQEVVLGTKLAIFFLSIPIAIAAKHFKFGRVS